MSKAGKILRGVLPEPAYRVVRSAYRGVRDWSYLTMVRLGDLPPLDALGIRIASDKAYYRAIITLVPELAHYKKSTIWLLKKRAGERGFSSLGEYYDYLRDNPEGLEDLRHSLTLKGSHFFRGDDWDLFIESCLSTFAGRDRVRVWCAGCSSGEEVYSTILVLMDYVPLEAIEVLATDYDDGLLERCRRAEYHPRHFDELGERYARHARRVNEEGRFTFSDEMRAVVRTQNVNLLTDEYPKPFDVIVCLNVIKFFSPAQIERVKDRLAASLAPGGFLFVGREEEPHEADSIAQPEAHGLRLVGGQYIYQRISH